MDACPQIIRVDAYKVDLVLPYNRTAVGWSEYRKTSIQRLFSSRREC